MSAWSLTSAFERWAAARDCVWSRWRTRWAALFDRRLGFEEFVVHLPQGPREIAWSAHERFAAPRGAVRVDPDAPGVHIRVRTGLIPIDGGCRRRQH